MATAGSTEIRYPKPPITEAVIALHYNKPLDQKNIEKFAGRQKNEFPRAQLLLQHEFIVGPNQKTSTRSTPDGFKLTSADQGRITLIQLRQFAVIHLAPYKEWKALYDDARVQWEKFIKITGRSSPDRVSTRFVNRIDIPTPGPNSALDLHKYFNAGASLPVLPSGALLEQFHLNCSIRHQSGNFTQVLQVASANPSPLIDFLSFVLDIDVFTTTPLPSREDEIWKIINDLRDVKNGLFEACITEETRSLFR